MCVEQPVPPRPGIEEGAVADRGRYPLNVPRPSLSQLRSTNQPFVDAHAWASWSEPGSRGPLWPIRRKRVPM